MNNAAWWAAKMQGNTPPPSSYPVVPSAPQPVSRFETPTKAQSSRLTDTCPECFSENYFRATPTTAIRCYDCGYPTLQSGSGVSTVNAEGPVQKTKQVETGGFQPGTIVGRIG